MNPLLGIGLKVLSALSFTLMSAGIKRLAAEYPTGEIVFFRSAFALLPLALWLGWQKTLRTAFRTSDLRGHILRGLISSCGMFSGFISLALLPLPDAVAIGYAAPLFTVVLAALILHERVRVYRWSAVGTGFVGVLVMVSPHVAFQGVGGPSGGAAAGAMIGLIGAGCAAGATIQVRRLTETESTGAIVLYFSLLTSALGLLTAAFGWVVPSWEQFGLLVTIGVLGGIGQILLTESYRYADASLVAPFDYTSMIWALLVGWFLFGDWPSVAIVAGAAIAAGAGIFVIWRERHLGLIRAKHVESAAQRPH